MLPTLALPEREAPLLVLRRDVPRSDVAIPLKALAFVDLETTGLDPSRYNLDDAKEKILVARQVYEQLPLAYQKRLVVDSKTELSFESNGANKRLSRILSHPSKAPRGKEGQLGRRAQRAWPRRQVLGGRARMSAGATDRQAEDG